MGRHLTNRPFFQAQVAKDKGIKTQGTGLYADLTLCGEKVPDSSVWDLTSFAVTINQHLPHNYLNIDILPAKGGIYSPESFFRTTAKWSNHLSQSKVGLAQKILQG